MNFKPSIDSFVTCEVVLHGKVKYFAKLASGQWVAVLDNGDLDAAEMAAADFAAVLETLAGIGADIRFTNHSAA